MSQKKLFTSRIRRLVPVTLAFYAALIAITFQLTIGGTTAEYALLVYGVLFGVLVTFYFTELSSRRIGPSATVTTKGLLEPGEDNTLRFLQLVLSRIEDQKELELRKAKVSVSPDELQLRMYKLDDPVVYLTIDRDTGLVTLKTKGRKPSGARELARELLDTMREAGIIAHVPFKTVGELPHPEGKDEQRRLAS
jgi:hypothetical protein